jgi:glycosyltransferase involved in cell wall biosynthesis
VKTGRKLIRSNDIHAIVSIGPPHTTLLVGKKLSQLFGIPHVPVFIDPWVDISYYQGLKRTKTAVIVDRKFERSVLDHAAHVVFVTESLKQDYTKRYPILQNKASALYWGFDEEAFASYSAKQSYDQEILLHAGNLYDHQNPIGLWKTLRQKIVNGMKLKLEFIGTVGPAIRQSLEQEGLISATEFKGFLPYAQMIEEMSKATYLLVCTSEKRHVPGKLFEYLRSGKPIIAFGNDNQEVKTLLSETNAGEMFDLASDGKEFFDEQRTYRSKLDRIKRFDRTEIAKQLAEILFRI